MGGANLMTARGLWRGEREVFVDEIGVVSHLTDVHGVLKLASLPYSTMYDLLHYISLHEFGILVLMLQKRRGRQGVQSYSGGGRPSYSRGGRGRESCPEKRCRMGHHTGLGGPLCL